MKQNIDRNGRLLRAGLGVLCLLGAVFLWAGGYGWLALVLLLLGVFTFFEALRGWCAFRACGIKTRF